MDKEISNQTILEIIKVNTRKLTPTNIEPGMIVRYQWEENEKLSLDKLLPQDRERLVPFQQAKNELEDDLSKSLGRESGYPPDKSYQDKTRERIEGI